MTRVILLITLLMAAGCSSGPESKIIGTWTYDRIETRPTNNNPGLQQQVQSMTQGLLDNLYDGMKYEFHDDGTCTVTYPLLQTTTMTKYRLSDDGQSINFEDATVSTLPAKIIKLTDDELWLTSDNSTALVFRKE